MTTWIAYTAAALIARRTMAGWARSVRHATTAIASTISPTTTATHRCSTCAEVSSVSGGISVPPMSGQSGKMSAESVAVTFDPKSSRANVASAPNAASNVNRWLAPRPPTRAGKPARTVR